MGDNSYDVIVVGVGGMGSATAFELARRGWRVLGLEQFALGNDQGSSHGHTRIIRKAYYEHPDYVPLVLRAYERWRDLEQRQGRTLLTECPCLSIGRPEGELIAGVRQSAERHGLPVEHLDAGAMRRRYPAFQFNDEYVGVLEPSAGFLYVDDCVLAYIVEARRLGATIRDREPVVSWKAEGNGGVVETAADRYIADRRAEPPRFDDVGEHAVINVEEAGRWLQDANVFIVELKGGIAAAHRTGVEMFHRQAVSLGRLPDAGDQLAFGPTDAQARAFGQQRPPLALFQVSPALIRPQYKRNIIGMFVVSFADDARMAVRTALVVAERELLQTEYAPAAPRQLERRGRPHAADADYDHVVGVIAHSVAKPSLSGRYNNPRRPIRPACSRRSQ